MEEDVNIAHKFKHTLDWNDLGIKASNASILMDNLQFLRKVSFVKTIT
jgi:hypothetical protein